MPSHTSLGSNMSDVAFGQSVWKTVAFDRFASEPEYFDPEATNPYKRFHETFSEPADVYLELARRITRLSVEVSAKPIKGVIGTAHAFLRSVERSTDQAIEAGAYTTMTEVFNRDAESGTRENLLILAEIYDALTKEQ